MLAPAPEVIARGAGRPGRPSASASAWAQLLVRQLPPKSSINAYAGCLRAARLLSVQDVHDVEQMGGLRNLAAHGDTAELDFERAEFMERQVSRFLRRLEDVVVSSAPGPELLSSR